MAPPQTRLGKLTVLPRLNSSNSGVLLLSKNSEGKGEIKKRKRRGENRRKRKRSAGQAPNSYHCYISPYVCQILVNFFLHVSATISYVVIE